MLYKPSLVTNHDRNTIDAQAFPKNLSSQAEEINRAKSDFIANISHDMRTPLHTILGTTELLKIKQHLPNQEQYLDAILQAGETLLKLVENILDFSNLEQDKFEFHDALIDLYELVNCAIKTVSSQAAEKGVEVILNYANEIPKNLFSNADRLSRILTNLLDNAVKFTNHGQIIVSVEPANSSGYLNLIVKDTGIGIAKHELKNIFERFYRVNPSYKGKYKGTGLGLAITQKLIESLQGTINVESHPGIGSQFTCTLPIKTPKPGQQAMNGYTPANQYRAEKLSVLLVEDVPLIQKFSIDVLAALGCKVTLANNATKALELAKNHFDLIFMDIGLPDDDGLSVVRKLRNTQQHQQTPIIALTAHATDQVRQDCLSAGVNDFLAKPASYKTLSNCISKYAT